MLLIADVMQLYLRVFLNRRWRKGYFSYTKKLSGLTACIVFVSVLGVTTQLLLLLYPQAMHPLFKLKVAWLSTQWLVIRTALSLEHGILLCLLLSYISQVSVHNSRQR